MARYDDAAPLLERALALREEAAALGGGRGGDGDVAEACNNLAQVYQARGSSSRRPAVGSGRARRHEARERKRERAGRAAPARPRLVIEE
jgi:hypothetical protein